MNSTAFAGLIKIQFPGYTVRLCDGGFVVWGAETYRAKDDVFGTIGGLEAMNEGIGEEVPVFELTLLPPGETPASELSQPGFQAAQVRFWLAEYDPALGTLVGTPDLQFDGQVDQIVLTFGSDVQSMGITVVSNAARLLERNIGNSLSPAWHQSVWSGETGHDNATGLIRQVAWGVEAS